MSIGPIQAFVIGFPDNDMFEGRIAEELARLSDGGQIRIIDAVFLMREGDGVAVLSVSDLDDDQRTELRAAVGALVGLGVGGGDGAAAGAELGASIDPDAPRAAEMVAAGLVDELPDGASALVLAIEHLWAVPLRDAFAMPAAWCSRTARSRSKTWSCSASTSATRSRRPTPTPEARAASCPAPARSGDYPWGAGSLVGMNAGTTVVDAKVDGAGATVSDVTSVSCD